MKTTAVRLYGENDLRIESFELPKIGPGECLMRVVSDTVCASTYKAVMQGPNHKRVPEDVAQNPIIVGHEMCGELLEVGANLADQWKVGQKVVIQPALKTPDGHDPGYSFRYIGGNSLYAIVPEIVLEKGCLVPYDGEGYYKGSLVEAIGCVLRAFKGMYHTDYTVYKRTDGCLEGGNCIILGGAGPMGLAAAELAISYGKCKKIVVTDLNQERLDFAKQACPPARAAEKGAELYYVNTSEMKDPVNELKAIIGGEGFDDAFVMVPVPALVTQAEELLREDGCLNFFAGPPIHNMPGALNLYRVHYEGIHLLGTAGSIPEDTIDTIHLMEDGTLDPSGMISHIMGLNAVPDALFAMKTPNGAKKVCYNELDIPCIAVSDLAELGKTDPLYKELAELVAANGGRWSPAAEKVLLEKAPKIKQ
jgi:threonine dehydrogenase-like Zn-dependent dehydrogenase